ncbi:NUDIX domain-containing protein [Glycomyces albus]
MAGDKVLAAARSYPPELAGFWEFPGGKVEPGETESEALRRECREELGVEIEVGERVGDDLITGDGKFLVRIYLAELRSGEPRAVEHSRIRWLTVAEFDDVAWLPGNRQFLDALREELTEGP